jgi:hypothetical protein
MGYEADEDRTRRPQARQRRLLGLPVGRQEGIEPQAARKLETRNP